MLSRLIEAAEDLRLPSAVLTFDPHPREFFAPASRAAAAVVAARASSTRSARSASQRTIRRALRRAARGARRRKRSSTTCWCAGSARAGCWSATTSASARARAGDLATLRAARDDVQRRRRCARSRSTASARRRPRCARRWPPAISRARPRCSVARTRSRPRRARRRSSAAAWAFRRPTFRCGASRRVAGIFAVRVHGLGAAPRAGVASLGVRPTVDDGGRAAARGVPVRLRRSRSTAAASRVEFLHKLRDEERYADLDALDAPDSRRRRAGARLFRARGATR